MLENSQGESFRSHRPTIRQVSLLYFITILLFLVIGSRVQHREFYSGVLVTEFLLVMAPALGMLFLYRYDIRNTLRIHRVGLLNLFIIFCIMLFCIPIISILNLVNLSIIKQIFGKVLIQQIPVATNGLGLFINILVIGGSAGICEEVLFRGVVQRGFERLGVVKAILITSFLFGLMHVDFQKLLGTFLLGGLIGFIVYRTNSLFAGMFAHFCNNSLAVLISYAASKLMNTMQSSGLNPGQSGASPTDISSLFEMPTMQMVAVIIVWGTIFLACAAFLVGLMIALIKNTEQKVERVREPAEKVDLKGMVWLLPPFLLIGTIYVAQGFGLLGIRNEALDMVLRFIGIR